MKSHNQRSLIKDKQTVPTTRETGTSPIDLDNSPTDLYSNNIETPSIQGSENYVDRSQTSHLVTDEHLVPSANRVATPLSPVIEPRRVIYPNYN